MASLPFSLLPVPRFFHSVLFFFVVTELCLGCTSSTRSLVIFFNSFLSKFSLDHQELACACGLVLVLPTLCKEPFSSQPPPFLSKLPSSSGLSTASLHQQRGYLARSELPLQIQPPRAYQHSFAVHYDTYIPSTSHHVTHTHTFTINRPFQGETLELGTTWLCTNAHDTTTRLVCYTRAQRLYPRQRPDYTVISPVTLLEQSRSLPPQLPTEPLFNILSAGPDLLLDRLGIL